MTRIPLRIAIGPEVSRFFESDAKLHANWADVQNRWGLLQFHRGDIEAAEATFAHCQEVNPRFGWAGMNRVQALALLRRPAEARDVLENTPLPEPWLRGAMSAFISLAGGAPGEALGELAALPPHVQDRVDVLRLRAAVARKTGDPGADSLWKSLSSQSRVQPGLLGSMLAWTAYGEPGTELLVYFPGLHELLKSAGRMEARMGNLKEAERLAHFSYYSWSDDALFLNQLGFLHELSDESDRAVTLYEEAARLAPQDPTPFISLAFHWSAHDNIALAFEALQGAIERAPRYPDLHHQMGLLHRARGENEAALASFRRAVEINPRYVMAQLDLAMTLFHAESWADARNVFAQVVAQGLESGDIHLHLGRAQWELHDLAAAEGSLRRALDLSENDATVWFWLGRVLEKSGDTQGAEESWTRCLELSPEPEIAKEVARRLAGPPKKRSA